METRIITPHIGAMIPRSGCMRRQAAEVTKSREEAARETMRKGFGFNQYPPNFL